ncbi:hypothetical protein AALP_AA4G212700 [Arabis alpina]|uniref:MATH domain-containing protein n=1 Tax=Arabis alpina TaxID=50452 RepID=A0A087H4P5_ARAAL|nr:hypothetical protein AALP_AA4G212700 [Arabis alpina]
MLNLKPSFRFEIDNFSKKESVIVSKTFEFGGCEWFICLYPKASHHAENHMSLFLCVANHRSLQTGWKRSAAFYFVVLNQSDKELYRSSYKSGQETNVFCAEHKYYGQKKALPLSQFQKKRFLENDKLIIDVYINVTEVVDGEGEEDVSEKNETGEEEHVSEKKETVEINGFHVLASKLTLVKKLFAEHPDVAEDFKLKNKAVKTAYMNVLLKLVKKLEKPPKSLSETKLSKARSKLSELMDVGFNLGWLESKLDEISLEKKKLDDESRVQKIEERVKSLELMELGFKLESLKTKLGELTLERKEADAYESLFQQLDKRVKSLELNEPAFLETVLDVFMTEVEHLETVLDDLKTELDEVSSERTKENSRAEQLEERLKNLEEMELGFKVEYLETKIGVMMTLEMNKEDAADGSLFQQLDKRVKNLEVMELGLKMEVLKSNLEEESLARKKSDDADRSCVQKLEERVKNLELMDSLERKKSDDVNRSRIQIYNKRMMDFELKMADLKVGLGLKMEGLKSKFEEDSLERKKSDDADESRIKNIELMLSHLKDEMDKKKDKSYADGFMLVD